jgi:LPXTG-site transpeptidase (sortase) family protein
MEAGYDYLLLRGRLQRHLLGFSGLFLLIFGMLLLAGGGAYYVYAAKARAHLEQLNVALPEADRTFPDNQGSARVSEPSKALEPISPPPGIPALAIANQSWYSGGPLTADSWSNPLAYEPLAYREQVLLQGFTPMKMGQALPMVSQPATARIMIPSLGIDSSVKELAVRDVANSRAYEKPANAVGHIPESANAGEAGSSWFFGHLESPVAGEGSVFYHLPRVPSMLRKGEEVFVIADNGAQQYLYRVTSTQVVHQSEMKLYDTGQANIHLVACVPSLIYDHRLIVTGELVGVK